MDVKPYFGSKPSYIFLKISIQNMLTLAAHPENCEIIANTESNSYLCRPVDQM